MCCCFGFDCRCLVTGYQKDIHRRSRLCGVRYAGIFSVALWGRWEGTGPEGSKSSHVRITLYAMLVHISLLTAVHQKEAERVACFVPETKIRCASFFMQKNVSMVLFPVDNTCCLDPSEH